MILDSQELFDQAAALTVTRNSTNVIDLKAKRDLGRGNNVMDFGVIVNTAFTAAGAATLVVALVTADDAALTSNVTVLAQTDAIGKAALTVGARILHTSVPISRNAPQQYLGVIYTVATGPMTAGALTAGLWVDQQANHPYPSGLAVGGF